MVRALLGMSVVLALIAGFDAFRGDHWDQFTMLVILAALSLAAIAFEARRPVSVRVRPDLFVWVQEHAARTDDDPQRVLDRALAAYRAEMLPDAEDDVDGP